MQASSQETDVKVGLYKRKITVADDEVTAAVHLTLRQSIVPCLLGKHPRLLLIIPTLTIFF